VAISAMNRRERPYLAPDRERSQEFATGGRTEKINFNTKFKTVWKKC